MVGVRWRSCSRVHREKTVTAARPSEQFEPLGSMIRSLEFQAGGFRLFFLWELYCIGAISEQFPLVPGRSGKQRLLADHLS